MISIPAYTLNDGTALPAVGLGTWPVDDTQAEQAVHQALQAAYRLLDTAVNYRNESRVGRGVARGGVPREEVVVTTAKGIVTESWSPLGRDGRLQRDRAVAAWRRRSG